MHEAEALLVVGSSLAVYSGLRFVHFAQKRRIPVAIVNLGDTRGDAHAWLRVDANCAEVLPTLARLLTR
jgi:NAD-dependent SIR2 family protein deacetylase